MPEECKKANFMPIFKKGGRDIVLSYKPVALMSVVIKQVDEGETIYKSDNMSSEIGGWL